MDITIHETFLGLEVRNDVGYEGMRWTTVEPVGQPDTAIVLHPPTATPDLASTFEAVEASGAEIAQEPNEQPYGVFEAGEARHHDMEVGQQIGEVELQGEGVGPAVHTSSAGASGFSDRR